MVRLGRYLVEFNVSPGNGNARVFDPESPARKAFTGLKWYPPNPALQVKARFRANAAPSPITIITSRGLQREYFRVGTFEFAIDGLDAAEKLRWLPDPRTPGEHAAVCMLALQAQDVARFRAHRDQTGALAPVFNSVIYAAIFGLTAYLVYSVLRV